MKTQTSDIDIKMSKRVCIDVKKELAKNLYCQHEHPFPILLNRERKSTERLNSKLNWLKSSIFFSMPFLFLVVWVSTYMWEWDTQTNCQCLFIYMMGFKSNYTRGGKMCKLRREKELIVVSAIFITLSSRGKSLGWLAHVELGIIVLTSKYKLDGRLQSRPYCLACLKALDHIMHTSNHLIARPLHGSLTFIQMSWYI